MERLVIDAFLAGQTGQAACQLLDISWGQAWNVLYRVVKRGFRREAVHSRLLGVDEKAFRKGPRYRTIVNDIGKDNVEIIAENRGKFSLEGVFKTPPGPYPEQSSAIVAYSHRIFSNKGVQVC